MKAIQPVIEFPMLKTCCSLSVRKLLVLLGSVYCLAQGALSVPAQDQAPIAQVVQPLTFSTETSIVHRFVAAHGQRALLDGYAGGELEAWIYPFEIFRGYRIAFRVDGSATAINGDEVLGRIEYAPDSITRIYLGPNFVVREKLFVPLDRPAVILTYNVQSTRTVDIEVHATPVLDLMWPAGLGGQSANWNPSLNSFVLSEPANGYSAVFGSPDTIAHDEPGNRTVQPAGGAELGLILRPNATGHATVFTTLNAPHASDLGATFRELMHDRDVLQAEAVAHYRELAAAVLRVSTPDPGLNQSIAWAEIALDQAWVCNHDLGCGYVGGYGPSRGARRPQYDWFFAGDGLVAADGAISVGDIARARDELLFVLRYRDPKTGMIWHELSQSAGLLDWAGKFPYMYVHVDITFQFLVTVEHYVSASGDIGFLRDNWQTILDAYGYCRSLIDPATSLPRIPSDKEGDNEQNRISDDLGLSVSWIAASSSFAKLANLAGQSSAAEEAHHASKSARDVISRPYWNEADSFWISGHTISGKAMPEHRSGPPEALTMHLFTDQRNETLLNQLSSASFQTDWGTRGIGAESEGFDPESYAAGSVWPVHTAALADAFWKEHRPVSALGMWRSLASLSSLDSFGHIHEVLAGNYYRPQTESVPEQTWSSAGLLQATVGGLLGLDVDSVGNRLVFAPRVPVTWDKVSIEHIHLLGRSISLTLRQSDSRRTLGISNPGKPFHLSFAPDLPLGATLLRPLFNHHPVDGKIESYPQQTVGRIEVNIPSGESEIELNLIGGVSVIPETVQPKLGDKSDGIHIIGVRIDGSRLLIDADVPTDRASRVELYTTWKLTGGADIDLQQSSPSMKELTFAATPNALSSYRRAHATIHFER